MKKRGVAAIVAGVAAAALALAALTPRIYAEMLLANGRHGLPGAPPAEPAGAFDARPGPPLGTLAGARWRVQAIAPGTFALGEPADAPDNYEYLLVGAKRALLIDAGSTGADLRPVIAGLTAAPLTVLPTHLHWDHTTGLKNFEHIGLVDLPDTRAMVHGGLERLSRYSFLHNHPPAFQVSEWVKPGAWIDLGGRKVQILHTPGHTMTSISIWDPAAGLLFTGDFIYTTTLYEFAPDSSLSAWQATADRLLTTLPGSTRIYGAHCCRNDGPPQAPWLTMADLRDARRAVADVRSGRAAGRGLIIRRFPVNSRMTLLTLYPFGNW